MSKYSFKWEMIGDIEIGRPNLGHQTSVAAYRLMQYCLRDAIEQNFGPEKADEIFDLAGQRAGEVLYDEFITRKESLNEFLLDLKDILMGMGIGILRVEQADAETGEFVLTISEDLDCSGVPETGEVLCTFDAGFVRAVLEAFTGSKYDVKEIDCWSTGEKTCRFKAVLAGEKR